MLLSHFLAKVIGLYLLVFACALFLNASTIKNAIAKIPDQPILMMLAGAMNLLFGILIIVSHNIWQANWTIIITILGWLLFLRGIMWLVFPDFIKKRLAKVDEMEKFIPITGSIMLVLGLVLCYFGFFT